MNNITSLVFVAAGFFGSELFTKAKTYLANRADKKEENEKFVYDSLKALDSSGKLTADAVTNLGKVVEQLRIKIIAAENSLQKGTTAVDEEARLSVNHCTQRLGALEQALRINDKTIQQIVAVITPPQTYQQSLSPNNYQQSLINQGAVSMGSPARQMTMQEQIDEARAAALATQQQ